MIGLSKIPRVVDVLAKRPQMQERLTEEVADLLMRELDARGVAVVIEASHSCMTIRGVNKPDSTFVTSAMRGASGKDRDPLGSDVSDLRLASAMVSAELIVTSILRRREARESEGKSAIAIIQDFSAEAAGAVLQPFDLRLPWQARHVLL